MIFLPKNNNNDEILYHYHEENKCTIKNYIFKVGLIIIVTNWLNLGAMKTKMTKMTRMKMKKKMRTKYLMMSSMISCSFLLVTSISYIFLLLLSLKENLTEKVTFLFFSWDCGIFFWDERSHQIWKYLGGFNVSFSFLMNFLITNSEDFLFLSNHFLELTFIFARKLVSTWKNPFLA